MDLLPKHYPDRAVVIMGLGYVGLTLATTMVEVGYEVYGIEIRDEVLEKLRSGAPHFSESDLAPRVKRAIETNRFKLSRKIPSKCPATVFIVTVGTPIGSDGLSRLDMVHNVASEVAENLKNGDMVVLRSTVRIGTTRNDVGTILRATGKRFDLVFCPERTIEGKALQELRYLPQIVGAETLDAASRATRLFQLITPTVVRVSTLETAEMIKLVDNAQRDVHFAYSNEVARLCDAIGINAIEVINSGKIGYPRTNLPLPGPVGGPCLEKDPYILSESAEGFGVSAEMTILARRINERVMVENPTFLADRFQEMTGSRVPRRIALLGLAFKGKPATDDLRGTTARPVFNTLRNRFPDAEFVGFDAVVQADDLRGIGLTPTATVAEAFQDADIVVILNNHELFSSMPIEDLADMTSKPALIYDFWNHFQSERLNLPTGVTYITLGTQKASLSAAWGGEA